MNKIIIAIAVLTLTSSLFFGQVGINTTTPKATLDVVGKPASATSLDGVIPPRLTGDQLSAKTYTSTQDGAMVYVTAADATPSGQTVDVTGKGFFYFDASQNKWMRVKDTDTDITMYKQDGTLTSSRTISMAGNTLSMTDNSNSISFSDAGTQAMVTAKGTGRGAFRAAGGTANLDAFVDNGGAAQITANGSATSLNLATAEGAINFQTQNTAASETNPSTKAILTEDGRFGVGTSNPSHRLHVVASTQAASKFTLFDAPESNTDFVITAFRNTSPIAVGNRAFIGFTNNGPTSGGANWGLGSIRTGNTNFLGLDEDFYIGNSQGGVYLERFRISTNGNVGINTTNPNSYLQVAGSVSLPIATTTSNYTFTNSDYTVIFTGSANTTFTLPAANTCKGRMYKIVNGSTNGSIITFSQAIMMYSGISTTTMDSDVAGGGSGLTSNIAHTVLIQSDGTNWWLVGL